MNRHNTMYPQGQQLQQQAQYPQQQMQAQYPQAQYTQQQMQAQYPQQQYGQQPAYSGPTAEDIARQQAIIAQQRQMALAAQQQPMYGQQQYGQQQTYQPQVNMGRTMPQGYGMGTPNTQPEKRPTTTRYNNRNSRRNHSYADEQQQETVAMVPKQQVELQLMPYTGSEYEPLVPESSIIDKQIVGDRYRWVVLNSDEKTRYYTHKYIEEDEDVESTKTMISCAISDNFTKSLVATDLTIYGLNADEDIVLTRIINTANFIVDKIFDLNFYRDIILNNETIEDLAKDLKSYDNSLFVKLEENAKFISTINGVLTNHINTAFSKMLGFGDKLNISSFKDDYLDLDGYLTDKFGSNDAKKYIFAFQEQYKRYRMNVLMNKEIYEDIEEVKGKHIEIIPKFLSVGIIYNEDLIKTLKNNLTKGEVKAIREDGFKQLYTPCKNLYEFNDLDELVLVADDDLYIVRKSILGYFTIEKK